MANMIDAQDYEGNTPMHLAALRGHTRICDVLVTHGANLLIRNQFGLRASDCAYTEHHYALATELKRLERLVEGLDETIEPQTP
jgi:ankyrin repeat protein